MKKEWRTLTKRGFALAFAAVMVLGYLAVPAKACECNTVVQQDSEASGRKNSDLPISTSGFEKELLYALYCSRLEYTFSYDEVSSDAKKYLNYDLHISREGDYRIKLTLGPAGNEIREITVTCDKPGDYETYGSFAHHFSRTMFLIYRIANPYINAEPGQMDIRDLYDTPNILHPQTGGTIAWHSLYGVKYFFMVNDEVALLTIHGDEP